jgi:hypothetical protein
VCRTDGDKSACWQCRHVKARCSLVGKRGVATTTPAKPRKRARIGEAGSSRMSRVSEEAEKESEVTEKGDVWGKRACEGLERLSGSLEGLADMIRRQNEILGRLVGVMEAKEEGDEEEEEESEEE